MNPRIALLTLWHATQGLVLWLVAAFAIVMGGFAIVVLQGDHGAELTLGIAVFLSLCNLFFWMLFASRTLPLAIDAHVLQLPGVQRSAVHGLFLLGLLTIALPSVATGLCGGHAGAIAALLSLCAAGGFAIAIMPRYLGILLLLSPDLLRSLRPHLNWPGLDDPRFIPWAGLLALALLWISIVRWKKLLHADSPYISGFNMPLALQGRIRRSQIRNPPAALASDDELERMSQTLKRLVWMPLQVDMRRIGPDHPVRSMRVALGGVMAPLTWIGQLQLMCTLLIPAVVLALLLTMGNVFGPPQAVTQTLQTIGSLFVSWIGAACGVMIAILTVARLNHLWTRTNTELSLLALLPGFKSASGMRRTLLNAILLPSLRSEAVLLVLMLTTATVLHCSAFSELFIVLAQLGSAGVIVAFGLCIVGGYPLSIWSTSLMLSPAWILLGIHSVVQEPWVGNAPAWMLPGFGVIWLTVALVLCWLGHRGWRWLLLRPHPFLSN